MDHVVQRDNKIDDPDFTIPVSIRVTDVNDNAPSFVGAPYTLNISELSLVGATVFGGVEAVDRDQPGMRSMVEFVSVWKLELGRKNI